MMRNYDLDSKTTDLRHQTEETNFYVRGVYGLASEVQYPNCRVRKAWEIKIVCPESVLL